MVVRAAVIDGNAITYAGERRSLPAAFVSLAPGLLFSLGGAPSDIPNFRRQRNANSCRISISKVPNSFLTPKMQLFMETIE